MNPSNENSAVVEYYQLGPIESLEQKNLHSVLFQLLDEPSFNTLRTKEQLGYIAYCQPDETRGVLGGNFLVQSTVKDPEGIIHRTRNFLREVANPLINDITEEAFKTAVGAVLVKKTEVDKNLGDRFNKFSSGLNKLHNFKWKENDAAILQGWLDQEDKSGLIADLKKMYNDLFFDNPKVKTVTLTAPNHKEVAAENGEKTAAEYNDSLTREVITRENF